MGDTIRILSSIQDHLDIHQCRKLLLVSAFNCYWFKPFLIHLRSLWKYARYFAKRHPKVTEDEKAVEVVVRLEENTAVAPEPGLGRRMTVRTINSSRPAHETFGIQVTSGMDTPTRVEERIEAIDYFSQGNGLSTIDGSLRSSRSDDARSSLGRGMSVTGLV